MKYSIGTTYEGKDFSYLQQIAACAGHIEVSPDSIAFANETGAAIAPSTISHLQWAVENTGVEILIHGVGLSIGSYDGYAKQYLKLLDELFEAVPVKWHSEHLAYTMVDGNNLGTMLTLPRTDEVIEMLCPRIDYLQKRYKVPFLLENVISMFPGTDDKYTDAAFLNRLAALTGCGLVLDVYNLQCDEINFGLNVQQFLNELDKENIYELHMAGGIYNTEYNFQMDVHAGLTHTKTIELAMQIINAQPPNLQHITYEILEEFIEQVSPNAIVAHINNLHLNFNHATEKHTAKFLQPD